MAPFDDSAYEKRAKQLMFALMTALKAEGFKVRRYKIENTLLDSCYNDEGRESLPEKERQPRSPRTGPSRAAK